MASRTLAASVVVTVSLGELALGGCNKTTTSNPPIVENPPPPDDGGAMDDGAMDDAGMDDDGMDDGGMDDGGADGAAEDGGDEGEEGGEDGDTTTAQANIQKLDDGTCIEIVDIDCPKGAMCNPPPPQKVPCPDEPAGGV